LSPCLRLVDQPGGAGEAQDVIEQWVESAQTSRRTIRTVPYGKQRRGIRVISQTPHQDVKLLERRGSPSAGSQDQHQRREAPSGSLTTGQRKRRVARGYGRQRSRALGAWKLRMI